MLDLGLRGFSRDLPCPPAQGMLAIERIREALADPAPAQGMLGSGVAWRGVAISSQRKNMLTS